MGDTEIEFSMNNLKHQKNEFFMKVGKHEVNVSIFLTIFCIANFTPSINLGLLFINVQINQNHNARTTAL